MWAGATPGSPSRELKRLWARKLNQPRSSLAQTWLTIQKADSPEVFTSTQLVWGHLSPVGVLSGKLDMGWGKERFPQMELFFFFFAPKHPLLQK